MLLYFLLLALGILLWLGLITFIIFRRSLLHQSVTLRIGVLLIFLALFIVIFIFFSATQYVISLVGVILPVIWGFIDSQLAHYTKRREITLILKSALGYGKEVVEIIKTEAAERFPELRLRIIPNLKEENANEQFTIFSNEVRRKPAAIIILLPPNNDYLIPVAVEAHQKGIYLITVDDRFDVYAFICKGLPPPIYVASDFEAGGRLAAQAMVKALNGKGKVVIISGPNISKPSQARKLAFIDEILRLQRETVVIACRETFWSSYEAEQRIYELLDEGLVIDGIFCCSDNLALGTVEALKKQSQKLLQRKISYPIIIGFDGIKEIHRPILDRDIYASVEVATETQGKLVVNQLELLLENKQYLFKNPPPPLLTVPRLISREILLGEGYHP